MTENRNYNHALIAVRTAIKKKDRKAIKKALDYCMKFDDRYLWQIISDKIKTPSDWGLERDEIDYFLDHFTLWKCSPDHQGNRHYSEFLKIGDHTAWWVYPT